MKENQNEIMFRFFSVLIPASSLVSKRSYLLNYVPVMHTRGYKCRDTPNYQVIHYSIIHIEMDYKYILTP
jgi:hypothetical protein